MCKTAYTGCEGTSQRLTRRQCKANASEHWLFLMMTLSLNLLCEYITLPT